MANIKNAFICALARFFRAHDIRGTLRLMRILHPVGQAADSAIETVINYDEGVRLHINTRSFMEWIIFFKGHYNLGLIRLIHSLLRPGDVAVDIGTNIGQYALVMCRLVGQQGRVYQFEPEPKVRERLKMNIELNNFQNGVVIASALSDRVGMAKLHSFVSGAVNQGNATLVPTHHPDLLCDIEVELDTLDNVMRLLSPARVDFLKIDTQGNDIPVLMGAAETIAKFRPRIAVRYDFNLYANAGATYADLKDIFNSHRYRDYIVTKKGLVLIEAGAKVPSEVIYAVPEEIITKVRPRDFNI